jgi:hypothetical protein
MRKPGSVKGLEALGRTRLSPSFFLRDFLFSEIAAIHTVTNIPDTPDLAIAAGQELCAKLLEPLNRIFGGINIRSGYRSATLNEFGNRNRLNCAANEKDYAGHIWDRHDADGFIGATACIVIPWFADRYADGADWTALAWWIHDHLPYSHLQFFPKLCAFNIQWHERPRRRIDSFIAPRGCLTKPGMANHAGDHSDLYPGFPAVN